MTDLEQYRREVFRVWVHNLADSWQHEIGAWDDMFDDEFEIEDWEWIRDNLSIEHIKLKGDEE